MVASTNTTDHVHWWASAVYSAEPYKRRRYGQHYHTCCFAQALTYGQSRVQMTQHKRIIEEASGSCLLVSAVPTTGERTVRGRCMSCPQPLDKATSRSLCILLLDAALHSCTAKTHEHWVHAHNVPCIACARNVMEGVGGDGLGRAGAGKRFLSSAQIRKACEGRWQRSATSWISDLRFAVRLNGKVVEKCNSKRIRTQALHATPSVSKYNFF